MESAATDVEDVGLPAVSRARDESPDVANARARWPWQGDGYPAEPLPSPSCYQEYESFKRGERLALPYYAPLREDPAKLRALSAAYRAF